MPLLWNYFVICSYFKLDFLKIEFQWKIRFLENWVIGKKLKKKKKKIHGTRVPCNILQITRFSLNRVFIFYFLFFYIENWFFFFKIEFQNRVILLDSFRTNAFYYLFWVKGANAHFGPLNTHVNFCINQMLFTIWFISLYFMYNFKLKKLTI